MDQSLVNYKHDVFCQQLGSISPQPGPDVVRAMAI